MGRTLGVITATVAAGILLTGSQAGATTTRTAATQTGTVVTQGTGWKHATILGVTSVSPTKTYTITFDTAAMKARYAPYYTEAIKQIRDAGIHIQVGESNPSTSPNAGPPTTSRSPSCTGPSARPAGHKACPARSPTRG
ncbi:hypothetical protein [Streptomyces reniochalinae]